jgi:hypothetical protein
MSKTRTEDILLNISLLIYNYRFKKLSFFNKILFISNILFKNSDIISSGDFEFQKKFCPFVLNFFRFTNEINTTDKIATTPGKHVDEEMVKVYEGRLYEIVLQLHN